MAAERMMTQAVLRSGTTIRTCWIEPGKKPGDRVVLKNSENPLRQWNIVSAGVSVPADQINRGWDNNI